jgi:peptidoglycan/LPS O-acetylase OafA/YrhL
MAFAKPPGTHPDHRATLLNPSSTGSIETPKTDSRRHDLDALRAFAMLLGILLHATISFIPGVGLFWGVEDSRPAAAYGLVVAFIHGWRMPLFFLISGFFTAMLWRKRGLRSLVKHRFQRIFIPLMLAMVTVIPLMWLVWAHANSQSPTANRDPSRPDVFAAAATGDSLSMRRYLDAGGQIDVPGERESTPLHVACLFGRADVAGMLIDAGASLELRNADALRPEDLLALDWPTTANIAGLFRLPLVKEELIAGRDAIASKIEAKTGRAVKRMPEGASAGIGSSGLSSKAGFAGPSGLTSFFTSSLFTTPVFHHLWFLWFLCWYVVAFALIVLVWRSLPIPAPPAGLTTSPLRYLWLVPLTALPQYFMNTSEHTFGPETSTGLLPIPSVFAYYAIFFGYGILYFDAGDTQTRIGHRFGWKLLIALALLFPLGLALQGSMTATNRWADCLVQAGYAWLMSFAMIGLFDRYFGTQRPWVRYLSDASYWLYLTHLPLVMYLQFELRDWPLPSPLKLLLICVATMAVLLVLYHYAVRDRWIGNLLNGKRTGKERDNGTPQAVGSQPQ